jgi:uncharacterized membrane protein YkvA (DUF1232 family)
VEHPESKRSDPFPTKRFGALIGRMPRYARLAWRLSRDPELPTSRRVALAGAMAYLLSPIDLVPGVIPVAGQLDDAAAALAAIRFALRGLPTEARADALAAVGLQQRDLDADLRTIGTCYAWMLRAGGRLTMRAAKAIGRGTGSLVGRIGARLARREDSVS